MQGSEVGEWFWPLGLCWADLASESTIAVCDCGNRRIQANLATTAERSLSLGCSTEKCSSQSRVVVRACSA